MTRPKKYDLNNNRTNLDYDALYREVMERSIEIQQVIGKHDLLTDEIPLEEWKELKTRFWNEYVYPKFEPVFFEIFPHYNSKRDDPARFRGNFDILGYNREMAIAFLEWLKREGFFHIFKGEVFFINIDQTDVAFVLTDGVPFRRYTPEYAATLLGRVATESAASRKKAERMQGWVMGLALIVCLLLWVVISRVISKFG